MANSLSPQQKAARTAKWATTMTKWSIAFDTAGKTVGSKRVKAARRWQLVAFNGPKGGESRGIVDLLAIRKDHREPGKMPFNRGDLFEIVLVQVKGGSAARPSAEDLERLRAVARRYRAKDVVLAAWKQGAKPEFFRLKRGRFDPHRIDPGTVFK
jgi:hypothetical protein